MAAGAFPCAASGSAADGVFGAPCGQQCIGDERHEETTYIDPAQNGNRWFLRLRTTTTSGAVAGGRVEEHETFYDGAPFVGLALGQATLGTVTRTAERRDDGGDFVDGVRQRYDAHGNVIESVGPQGSLTTDAGHAFFTFDSDGLDVVRVEKTVTPPDE